jgi:hypothetical protein
MEVRGKRVRDLIRQEVADFMDSMNAETKEYDKMEAVSAETEQDQCNTGLLCCIKKEPPDYDEMDSCDECGVHESMETSSHVEGSLYLNVETEPQEGDPQAIKEEQVPECESDSDYEPGSCDSAYGDMFVADPSAADSLGTEDAVPSDDSVVVGSGLLKIEVEDPLHGDVKMEPEDENFDEEEDVSYMYYEMLFFSDSCAAKLIDYQTIRLD